MSLCNQKRLDSVECKEVMDICLNALDVKEQITEIVDRQLIAGKNNYKEISDCFYEIVKIVQENY